MNVISIIIRTKNEGRWLSLCLGAISTQSYRKLEIIIVDNGSTDNTLKIAELYGCRVVQLDNKKFNYSYALNKGIEVAKGDFIVCLSAHCVVKDDNWLNNLISNFDDKQVVGVYGKQEPFADSDDLDKRDLWTTFGEDKRVQVKDSFFHNANSMIRKSAWEELRFDETINGAEDRVWAKKMLSMNKKIVYEPKAVVYHSHGIYQNRDKERCERTIKTLEKLHSENTKEHRIVAIISVRAGSIELPYKNIKKILGKPLIYYTIKAALDSKLIDRIIVSTDDEKIASIARKCGAETPFLRPKELATNISTVESVLIHAVNWLEKNEKYYPSIIVYLQVTDIFRKKGMIDHVIRTLSDDEKLDSVFIGKPTHKKFWKLSNGKYVRLTELEYITRQEARTQNSHLIFREDTGLACATRVSIIKNGNRVGKNVKIIINNDDNSDIDIHNEHQLWLVEQILAKEKKKKTEYYL